MIKEVKNLSVVDAAKEELEEEMHDKAKDGLKALYRKLKAAELVCSNIEREIDDEILRLKHEGVK